jgi:hypothetical protein
VRLVLPIGGVTGAAVIEICLLVSTSLSNVGRLAAHPKCLWVFNAYCDGTIICNDPVSVHVRMNINGAND